MNIGQLPVTTKCGLLNKEMKKNLIVIFILFGLRSIAQQPVLSSISIDGKPLDPKKAFDFKISKTATEIKIIYKKVDSIGKITYAEEDLATIKRLLQKDNQFFDSLTKDSIAYFQHKLDLIRLANTYFKTDSTTIYKTTHYPYWKLVETILKTSDEALQKKQDNKEIPDGTFCFFTFKQNNTERNVYIEDTNPKVYPLLGRLVNESFEIMKAHQMVMGRKNN